MEVLGNIFGFVLAIPFLYFWLIYPVVYCRRVAAHRDGNVDLATIFGIFFGWFAVIGYAISTGQRKPKTVQVHHHYDTPTPTAVDPAYEEYKRKQAAEISDYLE